MISLKNSPRGMRAEIIPYQTGIASVLSYIHRFLGSILCARGARPEGLTTTYGASQSRAATRKTQAQRVLKIGHQGELPYHHNQFKQLFFIEREPECCPSVIGDHGIGMQLFGRPQQRPIVLAPAIGRRSLSNQLNLLRRHAEAFGNAYMLTPVIGRLT